MYGTNAITLFLATASQVILTDSLPAQTTCSDGFCGQISYEELLQTYKGIFFTENQIWKDKLATVSSTRRANLNQDGLDPSTVLSLPGDGDACCATIFNFSKHDYLPNVNGEMQYIVHMDDADPAYFQLIPEGSCVEGYGACSGQCFQESVFLNLLVYDFTSTLYPPVKFDWFAIPGYCSCKNVSPYDKIDRVDSVLAVSSRNMGTR